MQLSHEFSKRAATPPERSGASVAATIFAAWRERIISRTIDDALAGLLGGYLVHSGLLDNPVLAVAVIQEILGRPLGPVGRSMIPPT